MFCINIILIIIILYLYCRYKLKYWTRRGIQQLRNTNIIFGNFKNGVLFRTPPGYHLGEIYHQSPRDEPYVGFYIFHKPCLLLKDPEIIKQLFIRDSDLFSDRHFAGSQQKDSIGMINLFGLKNPTWRYLRSKITPTLTRSKLKQMLPLMMETGKPMIEYLKSSVSDNGSKIVDAQELNHKFTADLIANVALATKTDSFNQQNSDYTKSLMNFFYGFKRMVALVTVFFMPELVQMIGSPMLFDLGFIRKLFWRAVESREKNGSKRGDYIDSVIQLKNGDQNSIYKFEGNNLLYQAGIFFTGLESSSTTSTFTLMELARNKECQDLAREDVINTIERYGWTYQAFNEMKYLDKVIAESIRIHPAVSTLDRYTLEDYKIPGTDTVIEKGTPIFISLYGLHGDPKYFDEPEIFNPERFNNDKNVSAAYLPFGIGPRQCIGTKVGMLHVKLVLSMILSEFEVYQRVEDIKLDPRSTFTAAADGINIEFRKLN